MTNLVTNYWYAYQLLDWILISWLPIQLPVSEMGTNELITNLVTDYWFSYQLLIWVKFPFLDSIQSI